MKVFIDGSYFSKEDAKISVFDHGLLYGDGIFEGIRIYNGKAFLLKEHIDRLFDCAKFTMLNIPYSKTEMIDLVKESIIQNDKNKISDSGYIRLLITRGSGDLGLDPAKCSKVSVIIITDKISLYPEEYYSKGISIITSSIRRNSADSCDPRAKSLNYLNNILAKMEAKNAGCLEALLLNHNGYVAECTADNIFIIKNNILMTPDVSCGALEGITRNTVIDIAVSEKIKVEQKNLTLFDIYTADECFITGSGAEIMPVTSVDKRIIKNGTPGPITLNLLDLFREFINNYNYEK
ncbi:MAG: branched-chain-amino-acid transaminase [Spirochaetes bacterium]|nr:branched-chain-amino-acid transaminase [Spirochaetota bacterium]